MQLSNATPAPNLNPNLSNQNETFCRFYFYLFLFKKE